MSDETPAEKVLDWKQIGTLLSVGASAGFSPEQLFKAWIAAKLESQGGTQSLVWNTAVESAVLAGETLHKIEEPFLPLFASFVAPILSGLFGAEFDEGEFSRAMARGAGNRGATAIMEGFHARDRRRHPRRDRPDDAGAKRIAAAAVQAELESQFNALVPDLLSHLLPFDIGHFEGLQELPEGIIRALGVSRLVRRALQPIVTCCTTPATWL
jgi:hypothetical protein